MRPSPVAQYMTARDRDIVCTLCAHSCRIEPGRSGLCRVRTNEDGSPSLPFYGHVSALHVDPVEKKPLYHFSPGARLLSVGFLGCNFRCPFCQNYSISQSTSQSTQTILPDRLVNLATDSGSLGIAYTYNEPTIHFEYVMEASAIASEAGLANVLVTNGHLTRRPARDLLSRIDAVNVDLKSFSAEFYRDELGGRLDAVLDFIRLAADTAHLEVTTLLIPGKNDSDSEIEAIASFVAELDPGIPLHLSGYYPTYRYEIEATSRSTLDRAITIARRHLDHVYPGNLSRESSTRCASCGLTLVRRDGYRVDCGGLSGGSCAACGSPSPIRWYDSADPERADRRRPNS